MSDLDKQMKQLQEEEREKKQSELKVMQDRRLAIEDMEKGVSLNCV